VEKCHIRSSAVMQNDSVKDEDPVSNGAENAIVTAVNGSSLVFGEWSQYTPQNVTQRHPEL
jgi:hypothetical protein